MSTDARFWDDVLLPDGNDRREENQEAENIDVPRTPEAVEGDENEREREGHGAEDLRSVKRGGSMKCEAADLG